MPDQLAAKQHTQNDGGNRQTLNPAIGLDQLRGRQQLGQDAVFGRRIGGGAEPDNRIRQQRVRAKQHQQATADLDGVAHEHDLALGPGIGISPHKRR